MAQKIVRNVFADDHPRRAREPGVIHILNSANKAAPRTWIAVLGCRLGISRTYLWLIKTPGVPAPQKFFWL